MAKIEDMGRSGVQSYIDHVLTIPKLSAGEERELFRRWSRKKMSKDKRLVLISNLRYVVAIALNYRCYPVDVEDLIEEGNLGLMVAFDKYKSSKGTRFITYAAYWIRAFMLSHIIKSAHGGRTGAGPYRSKVFFKLRREKAMSLCKYGECDAAYRDLARKMQMPVDKVCDMVEVLEAADVSLDSPPRKESTVTLKDFLEAEQDSPEEETMCWEKEH